MIKDKSNKEKQTIAFMVQLYCKKKHGHKELCDDCKDLIKYTEERIDKCPFKESKTFCSSCPVHCYQKEYREKIRNVMRFSGPRMLLYHPVLAISHMIDTLKNKKTTNK